MPNCEKVSILDPIWRPK